MLGKLIKYEWKSVYKAGCLILGAVALVTVMGWLAFQSPMWRDMDADSFSSGVAGWLNVVSVLTLFMYAILLAGCCFGTVIYLVVHFYRTMYTDEGYLTHTLPVRKHQILVSKILVSGIWLLLVLLSVYLSVFFLCLVMFSAIFLEYDLASVWREITPYMSDILYGLRRDFDVDLIGWLVAGGLRLLITPFVTMTTLFGAVSMGQFFARHRVLMAILSFVGIRIAINTADTLIQAAAGLALYDNIGTYMRSSADLRFIVDLAAAAGLYFVSWYVTDRKLNMV